MKLSEFRRAVADEFGSYGPVVTHDLVLESLRDRTADQALAEGIAPSRVWLALCEAAEVPLARRYGVGRPEAGKR